MSWLTIDKASGEIIGVASEQEPSVNGGTYAVRTVTGWPEKMRWSAPLRGFVEVTTETWNGLNWVDDPAKVRAQLLAWVKAEAERRKMLVLTPGGAKKTEYSDKYREVVAWETLGGSVSAILLAFNALPAGARALRFAYAIADAAAFGDTPADAIARFKVGIGTSASAAVLSAVEAKACAAIKAAPTVATMRAVAAAIAWPA